MCQTRGPWAEYGPARESIISLLYKSYRTGHQEHPEFSRWLERWENAAIYMARRLKKCP